MTAILSFIDMLGRDTLLLTPRERDAYVNLIITYERQSAPLPDDDTRLALGARVSPRLWRRMRPLIATFFTVADGLWRHERLDTQMEARDAVQATADVASRKRADLSAKRARAAKVRWEKAHAAKLCKPDDLHMQNQPDASANASAPTVLTGPDALALAMAKGQSQSIGSQEENNARASADAKPDFASKPRKRRGEIQPQPMLRTFSAIEGSKVAAKPSAPVHFEHVWRQARNRLCERLGARDYAMWIAPLSVLEAAAGKVVIAVNTSFERDRIVEQYGDRIGDVLHDLEPGLRSIDFVVVAKEAGAAVA